MSGSIHVKPAALAAFVDSAQLALQNEHNTDALCPTVCKQGMGMSTFPVPVFKMELVCGLVIEEVADGVRLVLPVAGIYLAFGNDQAGNIVWAHVLPPCVVSQALLRQRWKKQHRLNLRWNCSQFVP